MDNNNFQILFDSINIEADSTLGYEKTKFLYNQFKEMNVSGHSAEIGVYKGYTSKLLSIINSNNIHYCYDTFNGVVHYNKEIDMVLDGSFSCHLDQVKDIISSKNVIYKFGIFPETFNENHHEFSFVHSDTDTYFGATATFTCFASIMMIGGKILFDDYKWDLCPGIEKAVQEFLETNKNYNVEEAEYQIVFTRIK
jgi:O-methyltransferase